MLLLIMMRSALQTSRASYLPILLARTSLLLLPLAPLLWAAALLDASPEGPDATLLLLLDELALLERLLDTSMGPSAVGACLVGVDVRLLVR